MSLENYRSQINEIDDQLVKLFEDRMRIAGEIGKYKAENSIPVQDNERERQKLADVVEKSSDDMKTFIKPLYSFLFELSKTHQKNLTSEKTELVKKIEKTIADTESLFPKYGRIAVQGVEGAYSQIACDKVFDTPSIMYFSTFEGVFSAISQGLCDYGIVPIENSTAGSVNLIYDLMMKNNFHIIRSVRVKVNHSLIVKPGTRLEDIKEIFSHEQALRQCEDFIKSLGSNIKVTVCENTAMASKAVAESDRTDIAAISSRDCCDLYNLVSLKDNICDNANNYTRFICISRDLKIFPGSNRTSIMMTLNHKPGSLFNVLSLFNSLGINLVKLESRPLPERDFEFMFYFDLETSIYSDEFIQLINALESNCEKLEYLGSYLEII